MRNASKHFNTLSGNSTKAKPRLYRESTNLVCEPIGLELTPQWISSWLLNWEWMFFPLASLPSWQQTEKRWCLNMTNKKVTPNRCGLISTTNAISQIRVLYYQAANVMLALNIHEVTSITYAIHTKCWHPSSLTCLYHLLLTTYIYRHNLQHYANFFQHIRAHISKDTLVDYKAFIAKLQE